MSSNTLLKRLSEKYPPAEIQHIVQCMRIDPLVWIALDSETIQDAVFSIAANNQNSWSPGFLAYILINSDQEPNAFTPGDITELPDALLNRVEIAYEGFKLTGIPPESLETAGLLALHIARHFLANNTWDGISNQFIIKNSKARPDALFNQWHSVFACLPSFISEFQLFCAAILKESPEQFQFQFINLIIHAVMAQFSFFVNRESTFEGIFENQSDAIKVQLLEAFQQMGLNDLTQQMANIFIKSGENLSSIGNFLSQSVANADKPSDLNQLSNLDWQAQYFHFANLPEKSSELQAEAIEIYSKNIARHYHHLAIENETSNPSLAKSAFTNALRYNAEFDAIKLGFLEFLVKNNETEEALQILQEIQDQTTARFVVFVYQPGLLESQGMDIAQVILDFHKNASDKTMLKRSALPQAIDYLLAQGRANAAANIVDLMINELPNDLSIISQASRVNRHLGRSQKALAYAEMMQLFSPNDANIERQLVSLYLDNNAWHEAFALQDTLISRSSSPSHADLLQYANLAVETEQTDLAISICMNLLSLDKLDGEALVILGNAFIRSGNTKAAIEHMEKAASLAPESPSSWLALANIWNKMDDHSKALDTLLKAKAALPDNFQILLALGDAYLNNDLASNAVPILKRAYLINPDDRRARINLANAHLLTGQVDEAWEVLSPVVKEFTQNPNLALITGKVLHARGTLLDAYPYLKFAYHANDLIASVIPFTRLIIDILNIDTGSINAKEVSDEMASLEKSITTLISENSETFDLQLLLADLLLVKGESAQAFSNFLSLADLNAAKSPGNYQKVQFGIGKSALLEKNYQVSLAALQEAVMSNPMDHKFRQTLARAYFASGSSEEAKDCANAAIKVAPDDISNLQWFGKFMIEIGSANSAVNPIKIAMVRYPQEASLNIALAELYSAMDQPEQTANLIDQILDNKTITPVQLHKAIEILFELNEGEKAKTLLVSALNNENSHSFSLLHNLCHYLANSGDSAGALEVLHRFANKFSNDDRFDLLHIDLLASAMDYEQASLQLLPVVNQILSGRKFKIEQSTSNDLIHVDGDYSDEGALRRQTTLDMLKGDWLVARDHIEEALLCQPHASGLAFTKLTILFALMQWEAFSTYLAQISNQTWFMLRNADENDILKWMRFEIAFAKANDEACNDILNSAEIDEDSHISIQAAQMRMGSHEHSSQEVHHKFRTMVDRFSNSPQNGISKEILYLHHINAVWAPLSLANLSQDLMKWDSANEFDAIATTLLPINPVANYWYAETLLYTKMAKKRDLSLSIYTHSISLETETPAYSDLINEQVSYVERFIDPARFEALATKHAAITHGVLNLNQMDNYIRTVNDALAMMPLCPDNNAALKIKHAFPGNFNIDFAYALKMAQLEPENCQNLLPELFKADTSFPPLHFLQALCNQGNQALSRQALVNALNYWPDEPYWHAYISALDINDGDFSSASQHLEKAIDILPDEPEFWQTLGDVKQKEKDFESAKSYFAHAIDIFPKNPKALYSLAMMNRKLGDFGSAITCLEKAKTLDPTSQNVSAALASIYSETSQHKQAIAEADNLVNQYPADIKARVVYLKTLIADNRIDEAGEKLTEWKKAFPNYSELALIEAQLIKQQKTNADALPLLSELASQHPEDVQTMHAYADSLIKENYLDEAEKVLQQALSIDPDLAQTYLSLGRLHKHKGHLDQAIAMFSKTIALDPGTINAYLELGKTYQERREHQQAVKVYEQGIEIFTESSTLYYLGWSRA